MLKFGISLENLKNQVAQFFKEIGDPNPVGKPVVLKENQAPKGTKEDSTKYYDTLDWHIKVK